MRISRSLMTSGVAVVLAAAAIAYGLRPKPLAVDTAIVDRAALEVTVDADGRTRVRDRYLVVAPVAGRVERIAQIEGARIRAGDVVARISPAPLDSQTLIQVRARADVAAALALEASANLRAASAELEQRRRELSRAMRLAEVGGVAPRVVEEAQLAVAQTEEAVRAASERLRAADANVREARALLGRGAGNVVLVRAPAGGRVLHVAERSERVVAAGAPLLELGDPSSLEIVIDVLSSDGAAIQQGDRVRLSDWGPAAGDGERERTQWGRVREVEPSGFTKVSALGVEEQRVNVIVDPDAIPPTVADGFRVQASIIVWSAPNVVVVPRSALLQGAAGAGARGDWTTFVVNEGRVEHRVVRVGRQGAAGAEVLGGLRQGDVVVVFPSDQITSGARVRTRKA